MKLLFRRPEKSCVLREKRSSAVGMDFNARPTVTEMAELIRAELVERLGVRMASASVHEQVGDIATQAAGVWVLTRIVRDGAPCADECATPLIRMAGSLGQALWDVCGDWRMQGSLAYVIGRAACKTAREFYPLVVQREVGL